MTTSRHHALLSLCLSAALASCASQPSSLPAAAEPLTESSAAPVAGPLAAALEPQAVSGSFQRWGMTWTASNWKNDDPLFGCTFALSNVTLGSGSDKAVYGYLNDKNCAEMKSDLWKSQGSTFGGDLYVPNIAGTTTTLFTYFNDGKVWNEIDAEFVPSKGKLHPALIYQAGGARYMFEAWRPATAGAWHHIDVKWQSMEIQWYLDGNLAFKMIKDANLTLGDKTVISTSGSSMHIPAKAWPTKRQQLIANVWHASDAADAKGFLGTYNSGSGNAIWNNLY